MKSSFKSAFSLAVSLLFPVVCAKSTPLYVGEAVTVTEGAITPTGYVNVYDSDIKGTYEVYAGVNSLSIQPSRGNAIVEQGFCIDPYHFSNVGPGSGYTVEALANAPKSPGLSGSSVADEIGTLLSKYFAAALSDNSGVTAGALQVAIWDLVGGGGLWNTTGIDSLKITSTGSSSSSQIISLAESYVSSVTSVGGAISGAGADYLALTSGNSPGQDYVIATVPDAGATVCLLGCALLSLGIAQRKLRVS